MDSTIRYNSENSCWAWHYEEADTVVFVEGYRVGLYFQNDEFWGDGWVSYELSTGICLHPYSFHTKDACIDKARYRIRCISPEKAWERLKDFYVLTDSRISKKSLNFIELKLLKIL